LAVDLTVMRGAIRLKRLMLDHADAAGGSSDMGLTVIRAALRMLAEE
jgi:hypothetical protein